ncbi:SLIT and NTRK-like protein 2 [Lampetra fluviatilis]
MSPPPAPLPGLALAAYCVLVSAGNSSPLGGHHSPSSSSSTSSTSQALRSFLREPLCREPCSCFEREGLLEMNCEGRGVTSVARLPVPLTSRAGAGVAPAPPFSLLLGGNSIGRVGPGDFANFSRVLLLSLSGNGLRAAHDGAFEGLRSARKLFLSNNRLEVLRNDTFLGLHSLEYLQVDYNLVRRVQPAAFSPLPRLKVLILNDNVLTGLPAHAFRGLALTHLDLRGNRIKTLPLPGLLEHLGRLSELQLGENPWNCSCASLPMRRWLEQIPYSTLVGEVMCEYPFRVHGKLLRELSRHEVCSRRMMMQAAGAGRVHVGGGHGGDARAGGGGYGAADDDDDEGEDDELGGGGLVPRRPKPPGAPAAPKPVTPSPTAKPSSSIAAADKTLGLNRPGQSDLSPHAKTPAPSPPRGATRAPPRPARVHTHGDAAATTAGPARPPIPVECPRPCRCLVHNVDLGLRVNCQERGLGRVATLRPRPSDPRQFYLTGNQLHGVMRADFRGYSGLELLHLANNRISFVQDGAFASLPSLRRLYLNGNDLARLTPEMLAGLSGLHYLYLEGNVIREVEAGALDGMRSLQLVFLGRNLLRSLPAGLFSGMTRLARLDLRGNHLAWLAARAVLEPVTGFVQVDLQENPWDCSCPLAELRRWAVRLSSGVLVGGLTCESPEELAGRDLRSVPLDTLCPNRTRGPLLIPAGGGHAGSNASVLLGTSANDSGDGRNSSGGAGNRSGSGIWMVPTWPQVEATTCVGTAAPAWASVPTGPVPLSVLILGLLLVLLCAVFVAAGWLVFVLRRRRCRRRRRRRGGGGSRAGRRGRRRNGRTRLQDDAKRSSKGGEAASTETPLRHGTAVSAPRHAGGLHELSCHALRCDERLRYCEVRGADAPFRRLAEERPSASMGAAEAVAKGGCGGEYLELRLVCRFSLPATDWFTSMDNAKLTRYTSRHCQPGTFTTDTPDMPMGTGRDKGRFTAGPGDDLKLA